MMHSLAQAILSVGIWLKLASFSCFVIGFWQCIVLIKEPNERKKLSRWVVAIASLVLFAIPYVYAWFNHQ